MNESTSSSSCIRQSNAKGIQEVNQAVDAERNDNKYQGRANDQGDTNLFLNRCRDMDCGSWRRRAIRNRAIIAITIIIIITIITKSVFANKQ